MISNATTRAHLCIQLDETFKPVSSKDFQIECSARSCSVSLSSAALNSSTWTSTMEGVVPVRTLPPDDHRAAIKDNFGGARASNLYQATICQSEYNKGKSSLRLSRSDAQQKSKRSTPRRLFVSQPSTRTIQSVDDDDNGLDQPIVPKRSTPKERQLEKPFDLLDREIQRQESTIPVSLIPASSESSQDEDEEREQEKPFAVLDKELQRHYGTTPASLMAVSSESSQAEHEEREPEKPFAVLDKELQREYSTAPGSLITISSESSQDEDSIHVSTHHFNPFDGVTEGNGVNTHFGSDGIAQNQESTCKVSDVATVEDSLSWKSQETLSLPLVQEEEGSEIATSPGSFIVQTQNQEDASTYRRPVSKDFESIWLDCDEFSFCTPQPEVGYDPSQQIHLMDATSVRTSSPEAPLGLTIRIPDEYGDDQNSKLSLDSYSASVESQANTSNSPKKPDVPVLESQQVSTATRLIPKILKRKQLTAQQQNSFLEGNLSRMGSDYFGKRPSFEKSNETERELSLKVKRDPQKVIDRHLRILGSCIGQTLSLNRRGMCYFYYKELFVHVQVPLVQEGEEQVFIVSAVIHQFLPGKNNHRVNIDEILHQVREVESSSPSIPQETVSVTMKGRLQIHLSCTKQVHPTFVNFKKSMQAFRDMAVTMKEKIKSTKTPH